MYWLIEGLEYAREPLLYAGKLALAGIALLVVIRWLLSSGKSKVVAMTPETRERALEHRRFQDRYAHRKAEEGASGPKVYGPLTPEEREAYQETRARLKQLKRAA